MNKIKEIFVKVLGQFELYCKLMGFFASKEIVLEVNADKTKYLVLFRDQNAERSHNVKTELIVPWKEWNS